MQFPTPSVAKSDALLILTFLAGLASTLFGIHLNVSGLTLVINDIVDGLFVIVPLVLVVVRDIQHLHAGARVAIAAARPMAPAAQTADVPAAPAPSAGV